MVNPSTLHVDKSGNGMDCSDYDAQHEHCWVMGSDVTAKGIPWIRWYLIGADHTEYFPYEQVCQQNTISRKGDDDDPSDTTDGKWCKVTAQNGGQYVCQASTFPGDVLYRKDTNKYYCRYKYTVSANGMTHDPDILIEDGIMPPPGGQTAR